MLSQISRLRKRNIAWYHLYVESNINSKGIQKVSTPRNRVENWLLGWEWSGVGWGGNRLKSVKKYKVSVLR